MKRNLKNETVMITMCRIHDNHNRFVGLGYSITRQDDRVVPVMGYARIKNGELMPNELEPAEYSIRHTDEEYLGVACWVVQ